MIHLLSLGLNNYIFKNAGPLQGMQARRVTISPIGELRDLKFKG
jgi:hypothetical protein